ncbi:hypothetical protein PLICRDRAFT_107733 [Plicaturopsis crispa FD-325 SS-3]|nr:hypothetical protein PLICRDRAFT_107733 [Plicaturopsis crispa FD-325 SS-3]
MTLAPPPYAASGNAQPPPFPGSHRRGAYSLAALPSHILLHIVYSFFPQTPDMVNGQMEHQRRVLYWMSVGLRLVNRSFYTVCMHVLRSTYLPAYGSLIRAPYTSDPFPLSASSSTSSSPVTTIQRETQVLDLFIALKVREDVWADESELHLEREESFKDLFDLSQPRSRLEDLVRHYGVREGVVSATGASSCTPSPASSVLRVNNTRTNRTQLPFASLTVSFGSRKAGLILASGGRKRTIVEVARTRDEKLEMAAKRLVRDLKVWLADS